MTTVARAFYTGLADNKWNIEEFFPEVVCLHVVVVIIDDINNFIMTFIIVNHDIHSNE